MYQKKESYKARVEKMNNGKDQFLTLQDLP
jgi:hypothetical protein